MFTENGASLDVLIRDLERQKLKINIDKYNIFLGHPEANEAASQLLSPEELKYNIFIDNVHLPKDKYILIEDENFKIKVLKEKGLITKGGVNI